ncbi:MAG: hypothetical protein JSW00_17985 [Thermoplasmata archaeon]|nr:MAG: hypothetical protein JSW00_17985 [Thermoplasmata archaeon]
MTKDKDLRPMTYPELGALLHGILFAYEKVVAELYEGKHKILFPYIMEDLTKVLSTQDMKIVDPNFSFEENVKGITAYLSNDELLKGVSLKKDDQDKYTFEIEECSLAVSGVHDILKLHGGTCPFALAVAAALTSVLSGGRYVDLAESEYSDKGSKTVLMIK